MEEKEKFVCPLKETNGIEKFIKEDFVEFLKENTKTSTLNTEILRTLSEHISTQVTIMQNVILRLQKCEELQIKSMDTLKPVLNLHNWITKILICVLILIVAKFLALDLHTLRQILGWGG